MAAADPTFANTPSGDTARVALAGSWTVGARAIEREADRLVKEIKGSPSVVFDLAKVDHLDTAGAWLIDRSRAALAEAGASVDVEGSKPAFDVLLEEARFRSFEQDEAPRSFWAINFLADIGEGVVGFGRDFLSGVSFLGQVVVTAGALIARPSRFRFTSVVYQLESFAFRSVPIIVMINFIVGCIVAQQGILQLRRFGAATFAVDLIGILVLRELAVLLTSIIVAGRSGSAITAEIGSMKMREEIDALSVMGLDPVEVLVMPRLVALVIALPLLTFVGDMAAIMGGLLVTWGYAGISPDIFLSRLQAAIDINTFLAGLIKAPVMALVIGMVAAIEGMAVKGSAESLGRQVTSSVVKSIFMVIVLDGLFAMFFAAINF